MIARRIGGELALDVADEIPEQRVQFAGGEGFQGHDEVLLGSFVMAAVRHHRMHGWDGHAVTCLVSLRSFSVNL